VNYKSKGLATHLWESHEIVYLTRKHNRTRKFERIQTKSSSLGVHNEDDGRKMTINDKHHFSNSDYFISIMFLGLAIFCCLYSCKTHSLTIMGLTDYSFWSCLRIPSTSCPTFCWSHYSSHYKRWTLTVSSPAVNF